MCQKNVFFNIRFCSRLGMKVSYNQEVRASGSILVKRIGERTGSGSKSIKTHTVHDEFYLSKNKKRLYMQMETAS